MAWTRTWLRIGDDVCDPNDPRHVGRVCALHGALLDGPHQVGTACVRWEETGWLSAGEDAIDFRDLERVTER